MLKNFFISAIRNLERNRLYAAINVLGLALGIASCMVIFVIVKYETSFDDYHSKADRIYRVNLNQQTAQGRRLDGCNYSPLAEAIRSDVTGLEQVTGVYCLQVYQFSKDDNLLESKYAFFADQNYFDVFDVAWLAGNQKQALSLPNSVVVTDSFAEMFLGGRNVLGGSFTVENKLTLTVTGIVEAPPTNTDHPYSILISYSSLESFVPETVDNWKTIGAGATYLVLHKKTEPDQIYPQLGKIIQKHLSPDIATNTKFFLMPLNDNHDRNNDYSSFNYDFPVPVMVILSIVAGMIAFIACVNFVNLATAQSLKRAKEVGLRKTMGSGRVELVVQYMSEAFLITAFSVVVGMVIAKVGMTQLNKLYGGNYLQFNLLEDPSTLIFIGVITIVISILAGFYPAFILSGYKPVLALKSQTYSGKTRGLSVRRGLVICQFAGAQILILVTVIMINQIKFFKDRPYSFNPEAIVTIHLRGNENQQHDKLNRELAKVQGVIKYSFGHVGHETSEFYNKEENRHSGTISYIDTSYIHVFNFDLLAGKNFSSNVANSSAEVLVNESLVKTLGIESLERAIGSVYTLNDQQVIVRGVIKDSYTQPLSTKVDPISFQYRPEKFTGLAINISTDNIPETLAGIDKAWKEVYPNYLCKIQFMEDSLNREYGFYNIIFSVLGTASFLAIFIGCLGLYGLVSFMAIQRTKEIGIRKVFGATVANIVMMFTKESSILIIIAFVAASPLAHFIGIAMLMEFPERVKPGIGIFIMTLLGSLIIALLTVTYRSFRAAIQNPAESLRAEG
jgi:putative ABC transport system permease protein